MTKQTLNEKAHALQESVALPDASNWCLGAYPSAPKAIKELNASLVESLNQIKAINGIMMGTVGNLIMNSLAKVAKKYPELEIFNSEGFQTIALFFAVNYEPTMYHFLRYELSVPKTIARKTA